MNSDRPSRPNERVTLSTDGVAPSDRFEWWRSEFSPLHKVEVVPERRQSFTAHGEHWLLGPILIGRYRTPARTVVRTSSDVRRSEVDHWVLRVATKGVLVSRGSFGAFRAYPGQVAIGSYAQGYTDDYSAGEWVAAIVPRHVLPKIAPTLRAPGLLSGAAAGLLGDHLLSLVQRLHDAGPSEMPAVAEMTRAMITSCLSEDATSQPQETTERSIAIRERVERLIRDNLGSAGLNPQRICALAAISRSTLYRLFEDRGGVAAYVQALRLKCVYSDLSNPQLAFDTIASIAASQGLHNTAAFNRAFRRQFGCTPSDVRAAVLRSEPRPHGSASQSPPKSFSDLLR